MVQVGVKDGTEDAVDVHRLNLRDTDVLEHRHLEAGIGGLDQHECD